MPHLGEIDMIVARRFGMRLRAPYLLHEPATGSTSRPGGRVSGRSGTAGVPAVAKHPSLVIGGDILCGGAV
jgi:hypothetical protein